MYVRQCNLDHRATLEEIWVINVYWMGLCDVPQRGTAPAIGLRRGGANMMDQSVNQADASAGKSATARSEASCLAELRATILAIHYREESLEKHRERLEDALDAVIAESRARGERVEALIVRIKRVCSEPQPTDVHRLERAWLATHLVEQCIKRYYARMD